MTTNVVTLPETLAGRSTGYRDVPVTYEATGAIGHSASLLDSLVTMTSIGLLVLGNAGSPHQVFRRDTPRTVQSAPWKRTQPEAPDVRRTVASAIAKQATARAECQSGELVDTAERLLFIREHLSLNVSQLAEALGVGRPAVYKWLQETTTPQAAQQSRIKAVYDVARLWNQVSREPLGSLLETVVQDGVSVMELLRAPTLDSARIRMVLRVLRDGRTGEAPADVVSPELKNASEFAGAHNFALPDADTQQRLKTAAIRRASWKR